MSLGLTLDMTSDFSLEVSVTQSLCVTVDTPRSLAVFLLIKYGEFQQLVDLTIEASDYEDHRNFADDYLVTEILSKSTNLPLDVDTRQVALDAFYASERRCKEYNEQFSPRSILPGISEVALLCKKILGPLSRAALLKIESGFRFGPGATTGVKGSGCVLSDKYDEDIHLTHELIPFYRTILGERWWNIQRNPVIVPGSKFTTVPKNAKTDRGIAIEPTLNIYGQLGVGRYIRDRLRHFGVDLNTQKRNQDLASIAKSEELATIDLSAASDSISWKCVQFLIPDHWFDLLDLFRSPSIEIDGHTHELEKFSSMGNGYTFELESLIFTAVAFTYVPKEFHHQVSVYGDDIIVPQRFASDVIDALEFLGFSVNNKKSFLAGRFFESCGTDWFDNQPVRPFYLRKKRGGVIPYQVQIANALRKYAHMRYYGYACDARFRPLWLALFKGAPSDWRKCLVPASLGDTGFIVSLQESRSPLPNGYVQGRMARHMIAAPVRQKKTTLGLLLSVLARAVLLEKPTYGFEPKRGYLGKFRSKRTVVFHWSTGFEWH